MLHNLAMCVAAPTMALSADDGQVRPSGAHGVFHGDVRVLSQAEMSADGLSPEGIAGGFSGPGQCRFTSLVRRLGDLTLRVDRVRIVTPGRCAEHVAVVSTATVPVSTRLELRLAADLVAIGVVRAGHSGPSLEPVLVDALPCWQAGGIRVQVHVGGESAPADVRVDPGGAVIAWQIDMPARGSAHIEWWIDVEDDGGVVAAAPQAPSWSVPIVEADDRRLVDLVRQSLEDLHGLRMVTTDRPYDVFVAAGAPWFLTLFGRDSLWTARMMLPFGTAVAGGTLRTLAARMGTRLDPVTEEQPGKVLHELRRSAAAHGGTGMSLPPQYYGTVDATPLWICLLHDAWRWGLPAEEVEPLLDHLAAALEWLTGYGDADGDGFLEYVDSTGRGLANQGWKDSDDAVRFADGSLAQPPIALAEVQGYAHEAAVHGADLLDAFDRPGAERYRGWAAGLVSRFRDRFWVSDADGSYPAMALDGDKRAADALTSNIGHLPGTGLLDAAETAAVVRRVTGPAMDSGFGLRTMASTAGGYGPLTYHCGSVWPHDTAIAVHALARSRHATAATGLVQGLLAAGAAFDSRLPELYGGDARDALRRPVPYPAACRPQAWSAAAAIVLVQAVLGLEADVPSGVLRLAPARPSPVGRLRVAGILVGDEQVTVEVDAAGDIVEVSGTSLAVEV